MMKKKLMDIRFILANPLVYQLFSSIVGQGPARRIYINEYIRPRQGDRVLDIGCGPADILEYFPRDIDYVGFDMSRDYIEAARKRFGRRGVFICNRLSLEVIKDMELFDLVIAIGVLHHLNDAEARNLFALGHSALKEGGRIITVDPVYLEGQPWLEHFLISQDRGEYVRYDEDYRRLVTENFNNVKISVRRGLLRMPYSLMFLECTK